MAIAVKDVRAVLEIAEHRRSMGHISTQQYYFRQKNGSTRAKISVFDQEELFFSGFFPWRNWGYTPPPQRKKSAK